LGFGLNRPNGIHSKRQVAFIICSYFYTILNPRCNSSSNIHHRAGGVYCTFDWSAKNNSHNFWTNIQMYLNKGPCIDCIQTTKARYWTEGNWLRTTGCSHKNVIISRRHFLKQSNTLLYLWQQHICKCQNNTHQQLGMNVSYTLWTLKRQVTSLEKQTLGRVFEKFSEKGRDMNPGIAVLCYHYICQIYLWKSRFKCIEKLKLFLIELLKMFFFITVIPVALLMELYCDVPTYKL